MAQLKKVVVDVIVPVGRTGWTTQGLARCLRAIAAQDARFSWRVVVIDGSRTGVVEAIARQAVPAERLIYEPLYLRTCFPSDLLYQGVGCTKAAYLTYAREGREWGRDHLRVMVGGLRQSKSDVVVRGGMCVSHDHVADLIEANVDPCAGGDVLHTAAILDLSCGWPRSRGAGFEADVWRSMYLAGAEFFALTPPALAAAPTPDSTPVAGRQMMLFPDA